MAECENDVSAMTEEQAVCLNKPCQCNPCLSSFKQSRLSVNPLAIHACSRVTVTTMGNKQRKFYRMRQQKWTISESSMEQERTRTDITKLLCIMYHYTTHPTAFWTLVLFPSSLRMALHAFPSQGTKTNVVHQQLCNTPYPSTNHNQMKRSL